MRAVAVVTALAAALAVVGAVGAVFYAGEEEQAPPPSAVEPATPPGAQPRELPAAREPAALPLGRDDLRTESPVDPAPGEPVSPRDAPADEPGAFAALMRDAKQSGSKTAFRPLLAMWRTEASNSEQDRAIDDLVSSLGDALALERDKAAGQLLLAGARSPKQQQALASLLASSGSELAVGYLFEAALQPALEADALRALGSVSTPGVLPVFARHTEDTNPQLRAAMRQALRNMDTPKARDLEAELD